MVQATTSARWDLYRVLAEPVRLRLMALTADEELTIGELAELLEDPQPKISRHLKLLREAGLLAVRRQGTRTLVRLASAVSGDPVIADALQAGRRLVEADGSLARVTSVLRERDQTVRAFFDAQRDRDCGGQMPSEFSAYLMALRPLIPARRLAIDVGTGTGAMLLVLAAIFDRVFAVDRSVNQLTEAETRVREAGHQNVTFLHFDYVSEALLARVQREGGADAVFASRLLHHASRPKDAVTALRNLCRPGGHVMVIDYAAHHDERLREEQADVWLGFEEEELLALARGAGLAPASISPVPLDFHGNDSDRHLPWHLLVASRPLATGSAEC